MPFWRKCCCTDIQKSKKEVVQKMPSLNLAVAIVLCLVALLAGAGIAGMVSYRKGIAAGVEQRKQQAEAAITDMAQTTMGWFASLFG